jgi:rhamnosyltransferase
MRFNIQDLKIACIVPSYNGGLNLGYLIRSLENQDAFFDLYFVDSSSVDGSYGLLKSNGMNVISIPKEEFNHGGTRQMMVNLHPNYDLYVFLTQDAYLADRTAIANLVFPFIDPAVGAVCGRQLPHKDASLLAQHARIFNYPEDIQIKSMENAPNLGIKAAFMSNSFAAYRKEALMNVGGFPTNVIFAEDMYVAAKMLISGWKLVYAGNAKCHHSHDYSLREEFSRYFDMGVFHAREPWIREKFGGAGGEGLRYVKSELRFLGLRNAYLWPISLTRNAAKLLGFKLGLNEKKIAVNLKRVLGMHKNFWGQVS